MDLDPTDPETEYIADLPLEVGPGDQTKALFALGQQTPDEKAAPQRSPEVRALRRRHDNQRRPLRLLCPPREGDPARPILDRGTELEERVLGGLKDLLLGNERVDEFAAECHWELVRLRKERHGDHCPASKRPGTGRAHHQAVPDFITGGRAILARFAASCTSWSCAKVRSRTELPVRQGGSSCC